MVANREHPVQGSSRLVLAHFWAAFAAFAVAIPLGAWQMLVRSPLHRGSIRSCTTVPSPRTAPRSPMSFRRSSRWGSAMRFARCRSAGRCTACALPGLVSAGDRGGRDGARDRRRRQSDGPLHVLSAAAGQPLLLPRRPDRGGRLVDLGRPHGLALQALEARSSRPAGSARDVCHHRRRAALGLDVTWASARRSCS